LTRILHNEKKLARLLLQQLATPAVIQQSAWLTTFAKVEQNTVLIARYVHMKP